MNSGDNLYTVLVAAAGLLGAVYTAKAGPRTDAPAMAPAVPEDERDGALEVSPEIWSHFNGKINVLEGKVDHLTDLVERQTVRVGALERLLRQAMRIIRRANRRLVARGEVAEEIPAELVPYSID
ncbi:hypothetical protein ACFZDF_30765 [Streptomyces sp. NPDC007910]|uniref:hypothetical protein n=1 Tax=Streptomyces sp. NPDC007910 TaxID=3364790 RepID=UPI0036F015B9